ncbi:MAG: glycosyltransferase, partial [Gammaproteobacteria bacterium]
MYITLVISSISQYGGGAERCAINLANQLVVRGYKVSMVTFDDFTAKPFYELSSKVNLICLNQLSKLSTNKHKFWINKIIGINKIIRLCNIIKRILALRAIFYKLQPNVIISFVEITNITTIIAAIRLNIPLIVSERTHPGYYKIPVIYNKLRDLFYPKAKLIITQTKSAANYFSKINNHKLLVIPNAVCKPIKMKSDLLPKAVNLISVGRLCKFKGFETLIKAFYKILNDFPDNVDLKLTIYGEVIDRNRLEDLIKSYNLQSRILLPGSCNQIYEELLKSDLFIFPSHYEGFPNALAEAMAVGLPVIASNCSGNIELIQDRVNGRLFPIGDVDALALLITELINDYPERTRLALAANKIVEQFSEE